MTSNVFASFEAFCLAEGLPPNRVASAFRDDPRAHALLADLECGRLAEAVFEEQLSHLLGLASHDRLIGRLFRTSRSVQAMQDAVAAFRRAGVRTGLLSNSWGTDWYDRRQWAEMFDVVIVSGEHGIRKPEPAIYQIAVNKIQLAPEELVFVDDLGGNLKPARAMGMTTVRHLNPVTTIRDLEHLLGVCVRDVAP